MTSGCPATYTISFNDKILCFEFSPFEFSRNLVAVALPDKIILGLVGFPEEQDQDHFEFVELKEIYHESRCSSVTFSPETTMISPKVVTLCTAGGANLHIINSDLENHNTIQVLKGHTGYINSASFDYDGNYLASTGSDATLCIWDCRSNYAKETIFSLKSAGMSAKFHPTESGKLLVAEKNGLIHLYNVKSQQAILSLETVKTPLMYADWSVSNSSFVCAVAGGEITIWDMNKRPSRPVDTKQVHEDCGLVVKFSPHNENVLASIGRPKQTLKVFHAKSQIPILENSLLLYGGLSWHFSLGMAYVAAGQDRKLSFWKILNK